MARRRYDASEETLYTQVSPEEADQLLRAKGRPLLGRDALVHFLYRVRVTLSTQESSIKELRKAVESLREPKQRLGTPTTLSPLDAVKFASPEEMSAIVGHINSTQLNALQGHVEQARARQEALTRDLSAVRSATNDVLRRPDLPATVRLAFVQLLNALPETPDPVITPPALEMAHVVGLLEPRTVPATPPRELPDGDPAAGGHAPAGDRFEYRTTAELPQYGPAPAWRPGPGPRPGT